jgi:hypothetical protein
MRAPPKERCRGRPVRVSLEALVAPGHFCRHPGATLDLSFVRAWVADSLGKLLLLRPVTRYWPAGGAARASGDDRARSAPLDDGAPTP